MQSKRCGGEEQKMRKCQKVRLTSSECVSECLSDEGVCGGVRGQKRQKNKKT
jgi:hypothetical protein